MHWIKEKYSPVLCALLDEFMAKKRDARADIVAAALQQITAIAEQESYDVPPFLSKVCSILIVPCRPVSPPFTEN